MLMLKLKVFFPLLIQKMINSEIFNLLYLQKYVPNVIPYIFQVNENSYILERCTPIELLDFKVKSLEKIYNTLLNQLYSVKYKHYSLGLYKYFEPSNLDQYETRYNYFFYINNIIKNYFGLIKKWNHKSCYDQNKLSLLVTRIDKQSKQLDNWEPAFGYNLLHGDLHIGNIVKKKDTYYLIDYEYLRYGPKELELVNFIYSAVFYQYLNGTELTQIPLLFNEYCDSIKNFPGIDYSIIGIFKDVVVYMYYMKGIIQNSKDLIDICEYLIIH